MLTIDISDGRDVGSEKETGVATSIGEVVSSVSSSGLGTSDSGEAESRKTEYRSYLMSDSVAREACRTGAGDGRGMTTRLSSRVMRSCMASSCSSCSCSPGMLALDGVPVLFSSSSGRPKAALLEEVSPGVNTLRSEAVSTDDSRSNRPASTSKSRSSAELSSDASMSSSSAICSHIKNRLLCS